MPVECDVSRRPFRFAIIGPRRHTLVRAIVGSQVSFGEDGMRTKKWSVARKIGAVHGKISTDHQSTRSVARKLPPVRRSIAAVRMSAKPDAPTAHVVHTKIVSAARGASAHTGETEPVSPSGELDS